MRILGGRVCEMDQDGADHRASAEVGGTRNELAQTRTGLAEDRTVLASERSLLAWYRTAFGAYALSLGFGGVLPSLRTANPALGDSTSFSGFASRSWAPGLRSTDS